MVIWLCSQSILRHTIDDHVSKAEFMYGFDQTYNVPSWPTAFSPRKRGGEAHERGDQPSSRWRGGGTGRIILALLNPRGQYYGVLKLESSRKGWKRDDRGRGA